MDKTLRKVVIIVASLNLAYFGVEFAVAVAIGSVSLFADSADFLEDTLVNFLIAVALGWSVIKRARLGMGLAGILLIPGVATLWTAWQKFMAPLPPAPILLSVTGTGALVINLSCALILARFRSHSGSLTRAAFLSARNERCGKCRDYRGGICYRVHLVGMARPHRWPRHHGHQC
jgi:Co/Zn/Cd efflux system component